MTDFFAKAKAPMVSILTGSELTDIGRARKLVFNEYFDVEYNQALDANIVALKESPSFTSISFDSVKVDSIDSNTTNTLLVKANTVTKIVVAETENTFVGNNSFEGNVIVTGSVYSNDLISGTSGKFETAYIDTIGNLSGTANITIKGWDSTTNGLKGGDVILKGGSVPTGYTNSGSIIIAGSKTGLAKLSSVTGGAKIVPGKLLASEIADGQILSASIGTETIENIHISPTANITTSKISNLQQTVNLIPNNNNLLDLTKSIYVHYATTSTPKTYLFFPAASSTCKGYQFTICKKGGDFSTCHIELSRLNSSDTINGVASNVVLSGTYNTLLITCMENPLTASQMNWNINPLNALI